MYERIREPGGHEGGQIDMAATAERLEGSKVVLVRWPEESGVLAQLRRQAIPRLLLVAPGVAAPEVGDCEEDWIRLPADDRDVQARVRAIGSRTARHHREPPVIDGQGVLSFGQASVVLSPVKAAVAAVLVRHYEQNVTREALMAAWPDDRATSNALRIQILRLRRRLAPLGLEVRAVPGHGYRLDPAGW